MIYCEEEPKNGCLMITGMRCLFVNSQQFHDGITFCWKIFPTGIINPERIGIQFFFLVNKREKTVCI